MLLLPVLLAFYLLLTLPGLLLSRLRLQPETRGRVALGICMLLWSAWHLDELDARSVQWPSKEFLAMTMAATTLEGVLLLVPVTSWMAAVTAEALAAPTFVWQAGTAFVTYMDAGPGLGIRNSLPMLKLATKTAVLVAWIYWFTFRRRTVPPSAPAAES